MKRSGIRLAAAFAVMLALVGCGQEELLEEKLEEGAVDRIVVTLAMGNPAYGADCRIIVEEEEIEAFLAAFNEAKIGGKLENKDIWVADSSSYRLYSGQELVAEIICNGNDSERVWIGDGFRQVSYGGQPLPFELYEASGAEVMVVDAEGRRMDRPAE